MARAAVAVEFPPSTAPCRAVVCSRTIVTGWPKGLFHLLCDLCGPLCALRQRTRSRAAQAIGCGSQREALRSLGHSAWPGRLAAGLFHAERAEVSQRSQRRFFMLREPSGRSAPRRLCLCQSQLTIRHLTLFAPVLTSPNPAHCAGSVARRARLSQAQSQRDQCCQPVVPRTVRAGAADHTAPARPPRRD